MRQQLESLKKAIIEIGRRAYARGYVASNDGNISARIDRKRILITPSGISKGFMRATDLVIVDMNGRVISGKNKPSSELLMHLHIYKVRPDVNCVCHVHPPYATGFAVAGIPIDQNVLPEAIVTLGNIPLAEYGTPGTEELYEHLIPLLPDYDAFLLANHGALTVGTDIFDAFYKMETVEHTAQILFIATQLGNVNTLNAEQMQKLILQRKKFGIRSNIGIRATTNIPRK